MEKLGREDLAYEIYKVGLNIDPDDCDLLIRVARLSLPMTKKTGEALALLDRAQALGGDLVYIDKLRSILSEADRGDGTGFTLVIPLDWAVDIGITMDEFKMYLESTFETARVLHNSSIPATNVLIESYISHLDRNKLKLFCGKIIEKMDELVSHNNEIMYDRNLHKRTLKTVQVILDYLQKSGDE